MDQGPWGDKVIWDGLKGTEEVIDLKQGRVEYDTPRDYGRESRLGWR